MVFGSTNLGELVSIDPDVGTATLIGQAVPPAGRGSSWGWSDIAFDGSGTLFGVSRAPQEPADATCSGGFYPSTGCAHLYTIDPATGQIISEVGNIDVGFVSDIEFLPDGTLLGSRYANQTEFDGGGLVEIDPVAAGSTSVGLFGGGLENGGLAWNPLTGDLWGTESSFAFANGLAAHLFQIDPATAAPSNILQLSLGGSPTNFGLDGFEILPDGRFLATRAARDGGGVELYEVDPFAGGGLAELTLLPLTIDSRIQGRIFGLASAEVPEPGTLFLALCGVGALIATKRRRSRR